MGVTASRPCGGETGARLVALMYSVGATLKTDGIDFRRWPEAWLQVCRNNGGQPPDELSPWLPWSMSEERRRSFTAPPWPARSSAASTGATSPLKKRRCSARCSPPNCHALSREFYRCVGWFKPDGGLKNMIARVTMLTRHKAWPIILPPPK